MQWWTIGAFARAARLSPKALRLYDELGLLPPAHVDPVTGYRFYAPAQLERAQTVAWLRRLGMPLAQIRTVCDLDPGEAAHEVAAFWAQVEADTAVRRDLAAVLVDRLTGRQSAGSGQGGALEIRYAAGSDIGLVRATHQDTAYAGPGLLAVADGFGRGGAEASTAAVQTLVKLADGEHLRSGDLLNVMQDAAARANQAIGEIIPAGDCEERSGSTLTAMLWTGSALAMVHIGDSRAYLLRDGGFFQITHDHSLVRSLVDEGRLTPPEADSHPQRALLLKALDGRTPVAPQVGLQDAQPGDRFLLCSDGLSAVVPTEQIRTLIATGGEPQQTVGELLAAVREAGAPDNVSCVVADVTSKPVR
ncbi:MerR family transcriptional regulator [Kineosporia sp. NBRC 101731]|uniref:MerR family transcriptional regulator n=1 Tax=Kineosporia sp. NBRC 101731 TaxID=3032199 RepID=UPI0024A3B8EE|nr:MerR family transcriptional regulator [Kineosporia sp. NBRC 101731]GLY31574.1 hypothetical protein Kisp02_49390 [Kineosporia sp. NBRC 101731]